MATINFGDIELNKEDFLTSAANDVNEYVQSLAWSSKRKNMFMDAYNDLMAQNITGAKVINGSWHVLYDNDQIDLSKMSNKLKQMYKEAAWYIKSKMEENLPSKKETLKEEVKTFNNSDEFRNYVKRQLYGDLDFTMSQWNNRDFIGDNGLRGTDNRKKALIGALEEYSKYLDTKDFDYSNTPYGTKENLQTAIANAINALNNNGDYNDALNRLGLNPQDWLSDGSNDIVATDENGRDITRAEYNQLKELNAQKKDDSKTDTELKKVDDGFRIRKTNWRVGTPISVKTLTERFGGDDLKIYDKLANYFNRGVNNLSEDENKELEGIYLYLAKSPISDDEYKLLLRFLSLKSRLKNDFRKLNGIDGLYWDSKANLVIQIYNKNNTQLDPNYGKSLLPKTESEKEKQTNKRLAYLNSTGNDGELTSAEWEELASIGFDIASIVDPEMVSSAGLALMGSGLRHHAIASLPGGMSTSDKWWLAADYGLSILGSVPVLGDSVLVWRALNNLKKAIVPLGIVMAGANVPQVAKAAYNKIANGLDLTIQDWRAIGAVLTAAVGVGRGRQMSKRAEALRRTGGNTSKSTKEGVIKTSEGEIKVSESKAKLLKEKFGNNNKETRTKTLREDVDVLKAAKEQGIDLSKAEVQGYGRLKKSPISSTTSTSTTSGNRIATLRAMSEFNKNHGWLARKGLAELDWIFRHTGGYKPTSTSNWFKDTWNSLRKSEWDKFGNNSTKQSQATPTTSTQTSNLVIENPSNTEEGRLSVTNDRKVISNPYKAGPTKLAKISDKKLIKEVLKKGKYTDEFPEEGTITFKGPDGNTHRLEVSFSKDGNNYNVTRTSSDGSQSAALVKMEELKSYVAKQLQEILNGKRNDVQLARLIRELRKSKFGWLKQGGKFNLDKEISNFLKEINV